MSDTDPTRRLSYGARGLLATLQRMDPEIDSITPQALVIPARESGGKPVAGVTTVRTLLDELHQKGFLARWREMPPRDENNQLAGAPRFRWRIYPHGDGQPFRR